MLRFGAKKRDKYVATIEIVESHLTVDCMLDPGWKFRGSDSSAQDFSVSRVVLYQQDDFVRH